MSEDLKDIFPKSWEVERLGDFVITEKGKKPNNISNEYNDIRHLPYVNIKAFEKNIIDEYTDGLGCVLCEEGDFVMVWDGSRSGYVGKAIKGALGSTLVRITFPGIYLDYAYYFLQSKYLEINTRAKGVGIPHVDPALLWNYHFPIPPLFEQHRIVAKIEELFSSLDKGIESLKTAHQQLKVYRQAVLKWAFEGRLTNKNVVDGEMPVGWKIVKFIEFCKLQRGYDLPLKKISEGSYPVVTSSGVNGYHNEYKANGPCLITGRSGGVGNIHYLDVEKYWPHNTVLFVKDFCNNYPKYVYYYFLQFNFKGFSASTTIPTLDRKQLYNELVCLPPTLEQHAIVQEIESRLSVCDKIEESIEHSLKQSEALRQSILKKAFEGKLVPQDPSDEPASVLLERIKAEREQNKPEIPPRRQAREIKTKKAKS